MKLLLKSAVIAFSAIGIVLSLHTISYAADSSTANIANAPDITSGNSATTAPSAKSAVLRDQITC